MSLTNYQKICNDILECLPQERTKNIIRRRFALSSEAQRVKAELSKKETLESIGRSYGITRERVRQIEEDGFKKAKVKAAQTAQKPFQIFTQELKNFGGLKREDLLLEKLGGKNFKPQVLFLLTLGKQFERFSETNVFHAFWTIDKNSLNSAQKAINGFTNELKKTKQPLSLKALSLVNYIELSKQVLKGPEGLYGFSDWPEINPKGIKDKAFLVIKRENKPLHFTKVAEFIEAQEKEKKPCLVKTVHNELIKDQRFVLVGRGLYALKDWGYSPGVVKDVIKNVLKQAQKPLPPKAIIEQVLSQRFVQKNTILLNLQNKEYFLRSAQGKYTIKED